MNQPQLTYMQQIRYVNPNLARKQMIYYERLIKADTPNDMITKIHNKLSLIQSALVNEDWKEPNYNYYKDKHNNKVERCNCCNIYKNEIDFKYRKDGEKILTMKCLYCREKKI